MKTTDTLYIGELKNTPIGTLWLAVSSRGLAAVSSAASQADFEKFLLKRFKRPLEYAPRQVAATAAELRQYFKGSRRLFTQVIDWTLLRPFQQAVLKATLAIPYGETATYKGIAEQIGNANAARAVGRAEATNPMPIIIPCHRVLGTDGKLHGYGMGAGLHTKEWLLTLEGALIA